MYALADNITVPKVTKLQDVTGFLYGTDDAAVGAFIDVGNVANQGTVKVEGAADKPFTTPPNTITIGGIEVTNINADYSIYQEGVHGVAITNGWSVSLGETTINTGNITLSGAFDDVMRGLFLDGGSYQFDGTLNVGDVNVTNTDVDGYAYGVHINNRITGKVTVGNINASGYGATGFYSWDIEPGADVKVGNINVTSEDTYAQGVLLINGIGNNGSAGDPVAKFTVGDINVTQKENAGNNTSATGINVYGGIGEWGSLKAGNITVNSAENAVGINVQGIAAPDATTKNRFDVGEIHVNAALDAVGINVDGYSTPSTFTITKDVIA
jgi:hypothetical protein